MEVPCKLSVFTFHVANDCLGLGQQTSWKS